MKSKIDLRALQADLQETHDQHYLFERDEILSTVDMAQKQISDLINALMRTNENVWAELDSQGFEIIF